MAGYAIGLFVNGNIGDKLNPRNFLSFGILGTALAYFLTYLLGVCSVSNQVAYCILFFINGLFQSIVRNLISKLIICTNRATQR